MSATAPANAAGTGQGQAGRFWSVKSTGGIVWPLLTALAVTVVIVSLPRLPLGSNDDSSWGAVLGYAHQKGLQFGPNLAFTYGPLGFLITAYQCPAAPGWRLASDIGISALCAAGMCLMAWRLRKFWRWLLIAMFVLLAADSEPRHDLLLNLGLLSWGLLCVQGGRWRWMAAVVLVCVGAIAALTKVSYLAIAPLVVAAVALDSLLRRKAAFAVAVSAGFIAAVILLWCLLGQHIVNLVAFLKHSLIFAHQYGGTMQYVGFTTLIWSSAAALALSFVAMLLNLRARLPDSAGRWQERMGVFTLWICAWIFLLWKQGFVRAGRDHEEVFFGFVPLLVLLLQTGFEGKSGALTLLRGLGIGCCAVSLFAWQWIYSGDIKSCLIHPFTLAREHVTVLRDWRGAQQRNQEMQATAIASMQLPRLREKIGQATVDVFGQNQSYAVFNGLNYRPRPVFQSYAAYSESLMDLNEQFYFSPAAPQYVLFRLDPIDERYATLEDAKVFRDLLVNYSPVDAEGPFLLLRSKGSTLPELEPVLGGKLRPGQPLSMEGYGNADLWLELDLNLNLAGNARAAVYKLPLPELGVWVRSGQGLRMARFRAPAPMLRAGFVASPMLLDNQDVLDVYTGQAVARPAAYSVELDSASRSYWQESIGFRLYRIKERLGHSAPRELTRLLKYPGFEVAPAAVVARTNAVLEVRGKSALYLPPGSYMRFIVPAGAKSVRGSFGFAPGAYTFGGNTAGAEFRIDEEFPDGRMQSVYSRTLRPVSVADDRGLQSFSVECPGEGQRELLLRIVPLGDKVLPSDLSCWADIGFR